MKVNILPVQFLILAENNTSENNSVVSRHFFNALGILSLILAIIGVILPVMPTTVFILLAAYFFARGSKHLHDWLHGNKFFGKIIRNYNEGRGMTVGSKIFSITFLWIGIIYSFFRVDMLWLKIALLVIAISVTVHLLMISTYRQRDDETGN